MPRIDVVFGIRTVCFEFAAALRVSSIGKVFQSAGSSCNITLMECDWTDQRDAWIFVVAGENERDRRFTEGVLRGARERGFRRIMPVDYEDGFTAIYHDEGKFRGRPFAVLGHLRDQTLLRELARSKVPCVFFGKSEGEAARRIVREHSVVCGTDNAAIGRMAADYFAGQRRYASAAYLDLESWSANEWWSRERREAFAEAIHGHGVAYAGAHLLLDDDFSPEMMLARFGAFVEGIPKPLAIFACNDKAAHDAALCCDVLGLKVPDDIAILGVDNDPAFCETAPVGLSSVALETMRLGHSAMALVAQMLRGDRPETTAVFCPPSHVVERASTSTTPLADLFVGKAVDFISANADRAVSVADVAEACGTSRRFLERRFKALTGRTILDTIHAKRLAAVEALLRKPDLPVKTIAIRTGFADVSSLCALFRRAHGCSMGEWRAKRR